MIRRQYDQSRRPERLGRAGYLFIEALDTSSSTDSSRGLVVCKATAKKARQGVRIVPAEPDALAETGAGITLTKKTARHARRPSGAPGKARLRFFFGSE